MIWLFIAIICSSSISLGLRLSKKYDLNELNIFLMNYLFCSFISLFFIQRLPSDASSIILGIIAGFLYLTSLYAFNYNMQRSGVILASTFMKLGVLVPTLLAIFLFNESLTLYRFLGILLAIVAIIVMNQKSENESLHLFALLLLLVLEGFGSSMTNIFNHYGSLSDKDFFLFMIFFSAFIFTLFIKNAKIQKLEVLFGLLIGFFNYFSSRFILMALESIDSLIVYPVYSISTLLLITVVGIFFFKEDFKKRKGIALGLITIALCLLNI